MMIVMLVTLAACSNKTNTARSRFWQSFTTKYNVYYHGKTNYDEQLKAMMDAYEDDYSQRLYMHPAEARSNPKAPQPSGSFDRTIEKMEKAITLHSIKKKPKRKSGKNRDPKYQEWLARDEYNPYLHNAWYMLAKAQYMKGDFLDAAATFRYITRHFTWKKDLVQECQVREALCYCAMGWPAEADNVLTHVHMDEITNKRVRALANAAFADYYIKAQEPEQAIPYLAKAVKGFKGSNKVRMSFLLGQLYEEVGDKHNAYLAYKQAGSSSGSTYRTKFNARIKQSAVYEGASIASEVKALKRMTRYDRNKEYLDQVYYAIGNTYLTQKDTLNAIEAYEMGCKKSTRNGVEKGVLLLTLGNVYWQMEKYGDAQRCYGQAIGLLDKDRKDYEQLSERSKILDELAPHTDAVELQDSLQRLANMSEDERNKVIDQIIAELIEKEKEEQRNLEEAEAERISQQQAAMGGVQPLTPSPQPSLPQTTGSSSWYFYNPQAVNQGKQVFQRLWGKRQNEDNWQRINKTVVENTEKTDSPGSSGTPDKPDEQGGSEIPEELGNSGKADENLPDSAALNDPHQREYYLAQIPFTEEQLAASDNLIKDGLFHAGIIFKDKLDNLRLSKKYLDRLTTQYADYEHNDEAWYHLFLLYSRQGNKEMADWCVEKLKQDFPESEWTILLSDPYFAENQRFGVHLEDSLYAATYNAFKENRYEEVKTNTQLSKSRFPLGQHRPKFLFIEGLSLLNEGDFTQCTERMKQVVEKYPQSEVSEMAGMIIRGVQQGKQLNGGKFDLGDVWTLRDADRMAQDSTHIDTLSIELDVKHVFLLAYQPDSVNQNQLLYEMAKHNFSNYLVRNFEIVIDQDTHGLSRMIISGFLSYDEARQYARQLYGAGGMLADLLKHCRSLIVSEQNLPLLGTTFSYADYELFFEKQLAPIEISKKPLLEEPETIIQEEEEDEEETEDTDNPENANENNGGYIEFDDDFWR